MSSFSPRRVLLAGSAIAVVALIALFVRRPEPPSTPLAARPSPTSGSTAPPRPERPVGREAGSPVPKPARGFDLTPGRHLVFDLRLEMKTALQFIQPDGDDESLAQMRQELPESVSASLHGTLDVTVLRREDTGAVLRVLLEKPRLDTPPGLPVPKLDVVAFERPLLVRFAEDGRVLGYGFDPSCGADAKRLMISLLASSHQFVARDAGTMWEVSGLSDDIGEYTASFRWEAPSLFPEDESERVLRRTILRYDRLPSAGAFGVQTTIERSVAEADFDDGWIRQSQAREQRHGEAAGIVQVQDSLWLSLKRIRNEIRPLDPAVAAATTSKWETIRDVAAGAARAGEEEKDGVATGRDAEAKLEEFLNTLARLAAEGKLDQREAYDAWDGLAALLGRNPSLLAKLEQQLADGLLDGDTARFALTAVGKAAGGGSAEAADMLVRFVDDPPEADMRMWALFAGHELGGYSDRMLDPIARVLEADDSSPDLKTAAALLNGTILGSDGLTRAAEDKALGNLGAVRDFAFSSGQPALYLEVLGNTARADLIDDALNYVNDEREDVRLAAVEALRGMAGNEKGMAALLREATQETSLSTRLAAIDVLGALPASEASSALLLRIATSATEDAVRVHGVLALAQQARDGIAAARQTLEKLRGDSSPQIRSLASQALEDVKDAK